MDSKKSSYVNFSLLVYNSTHSSIKLRKEWLFRICVAKFAYQCSNFILYSQFYQKGPNFQAKYLQTDRKSEFSKKVNRLQLLLICAKYLIKKEKLKTLLPGHVLFACFSQKMGLTYLVSHMQQKKCVLFGTLIL